MSWLKTRPLETSIEIIEGLSRICSELGGPVARDLYSRVLRRDYLSVIDYEFSYDDSLSVNDAIYARQIQGFLSKQDFLVLPGVDRERSAWEKFSASEQMCLETNRRFRRPDLLKSSVSVVLHYAQRKISDILGDVPPLDTVDFCFGPGANTSVKSAVACARTKLSASLECSPNLLPIVGGFLAEFPLWMQHHFSSQSDELWNVPVHVSRGKLQFVPKTCKTHRSIVVEPLLNGLFQKGIGSYMKSRLLLHGLDLRDQTRNQTLARVGSIDGSLATIDLSSASDCISRLLVWDLLPYEWARVLDAGRSPEVEYNGEVIRLEKFSSMGNAYTFELETLIFYSLCYGVCRSLDVSLDSVSVYGDDIIIPVDAFGLLEEVLTVCGFSLNRKKSFSGGSFRESCGADYYHGIDIRPFYLRSQISDQVLFTMHNWFLRHGERELAAAVVPFVHPHNLIYGPDGYGDGHLVGTWTPKSNRRLRRDGWCGSFFDTFVLRQKSFRKPLPGDWVLPSYSVYTRSGELSPTDPDVVRGSRGYAKKSIYTLALGVFS